MHRLSEEQIEQITSLLKEGKPLPDDYKATLFETKKEYELVYADKAREEDILADTMAVPLQMVKAFGNGKATDDWANMLIFGDNLQVLKSLLQMKQAGELRNADGTPGVRLIYLDPPFATQQEFRGSQEQKAYQDKITGAKFLEFLRKRLVILRELLSDNGTIYLHLDWKKAHYAKAIMDEVFGEEKLINEIVWCYTGPSQTSGYFPKKHETIFWYAKGRTWTFNSEQLRVAYRKSNLWTGSTSAIGRGTDEVLKQLDERGKLVEDWWSDIATIGYSHTEIVDYPTQKPEALLNRIVRASSNGGDLVLDCFAGSGTSLAVAEKLGRRWVGVDCGKLAIYTMQKRLLTIQESKSLDDPKKKYGRNCAPFALYNAGLYDYQALKALPWEQYRQFALTLFQCRDDQHTIGGLQLDGYLGADSVMVFNYQEHQNAMVDRTFIEQLHATLGKKIGHRFFLIAPFGSVAFLEDYREVDGTKYYILRIPYSIIEEIHKRGFSKLKQPVSVSDVNDTVDAVGFDFVQTPTVDCTYTLEKVKDPDLLNQGSKECVIGIKTFESKVISKKPMALANMESLSMVMLDYDFDGEVFDLDEVFYAEDLKKNDYEVRFASDKIDGQCMIIYLDIFGNEKREVKKLSDFTNGKAK
jgi:site-specific DNA-methyltransferase (adenine-specific)/adenine-specific DNA-methyltransferase